MRCSVVVRTNRCINLLLIVGMLNECSNGLKDRILLKDSMESCSEDTYVKVVDFLKSATSSDMVGMFPICVKIVSRISPLIEDLMHLYTCRLYFELHGY